MRQPRDRRRPGVRIRLSTRDEALLRVLARFRIARTGDLAGLVFGHVRRDTAATRLRRLYDAGFLQVVAGDRASENVYALGPRGRDWAAEHAVPVGRRPRDSGHHLAIVRAWVLLALAVHGREGVHLDLVRPDWEIRGSAVSTLVPDAMVQLRRDRPAGPETLRLCVEVDCGTEPLRVLKDKFRRFALTRLNPSGLLGWREFGLLVVLAGSGADREPRFAGLLREIWHGPGVVMCLEHGVEAMGHALAELLDTPLTDSPCGKGMGGSVTRCLASESVSSGPGH